MSNSRKFTILHHKIKINTKYKLSTKLFVIQITSSGIYKYFKIVISIIVCFPVIMNSILKALFNPKV